MEADELEKLTEEKRKQREERKKRLAATQKTVYRQIHRGYLLILMEDRILVLEWQNHK